MREEPRNGPRESPYRRHQAGPSRWDRGAVIHAIGEWAAQTGRPPESREWLGDDTNADLATKWRAEFPRWPSSQTVARLFDGSWSRALTAAGYPQPVLQYTLTLPERVLIARRLAADGLARAMIAEHLGVGQVTVWRYLNATPCAACATPVTTQRALCQACARERRPGPARTREHVLQAITAWATETLQTPAFRDWMPSPDPEQPNRWEREWPRWPHASSVTTHFPTWTDALQAAGLPRRYHGRWTNEEILDALRRWNAQNSRLPTTADWNRATHEHPVASTVKHRFGRWSTALAAAGISRRTA